MHTLYIVTIGCTYTFNVSRSRKDHLTSFQNRSPTVTMLEFVPASAPPRACIMYDLLQGITEPYSHFGAFSGVSFGCLRLDGRARSRLHFYCQESFTFLLLMVLGGQWGLALNIDHISPATIPCSETPSFLCITFLGSHTRRYTMHQHDLPLTPYGFIEMYVLLPHFCQSWLDGAVTQNWAATSLCY